MRRSSLPILLALSSLFASAGCGFYFGGDDDDCLYPATGAYDEGQELRNPVTGQCEYFGGWYPCDGVCGPCEYDEPAIADPSWGACYSECSGLDENTCADTAGCRGGYIDTCPPNADCDSSAIAFVECWAVDQTGPVQGECGGLDAWECSRHDDCRAVHWSTGFDACTDASCVGDFAWCMNEVEPVDPGSCYGDVLCDIVEPVCPPDSVPGIKDGCYTGYCIPVAECEPPPACDTLTENACIDRADCDPLYEGVDCTCDANGCDCADWIFDSCTAS